MLQKWYTIILLILGCILIIRLFTIIINPSSKTMKAEDMMEKHFKGQASTIKRLKTCGFR